MSEHGRPARAGDPPRRRATALWAGLAAAVIVAALLITGLVAPGFLLGEDDPRRGAEPSADHPAGPPGSGRPGGGNKLAEKFVAALNNDDRAKATALRCEPNANRKDINQVIDGDARIKIESPDNGDSSTATIRLSGTLNGKEYTGALSVRIGAGQRWCVDSLTGFAG